jgi:hypothetical protein
MKSSNEPCVPSSIVPPSYIQHVQNVFAKFNGWWVPVIRTFLKNQKSENRMHWKTRHTWVHWNTKASHPHTSVVWRTVLADSASVQAFIVLMEQSGYAMSLVGSLAVLLGRVSRSMYVHLSPQRSLNLLRGVICLQCRKKNWSSRSGCIQCILNSKKWSTN